MASRAGVRWSWAWMWAIVLASVVLARGAGGVRSLMRGGSRARDLSLDTNALQSLQGVWLKDTRDEQRGIALDPRKTWEAFMKNDQRQKDQRRLRKNRRRNRKNQIPVPREGPAGPPGRRGAVGPQGPPGGPLSTREMEEYIRDFITDYLRTNNTVNGTELGGGGRWSGRGRVRAAFTATLPRPAILRPSALSIVDSFTITFTPGVFERRMVVEHGGFTAIRRGIYQVTASLVLSPLPLPGPPSTPHQGTQDISVYLCITTCTRERRRLKWSGGIGDNSVTAVLVGHVMLLRGDTLLVALDNPTKRALQAGTGSSFSAALIGT